MKITALLPIPSVLAAHRARLELTNADLAALYGTVEEIITGYLALDDDAVIPHAIP